MNFICTLIIYLLMIPFFINSSVIIWQQLSTSLWEHQMLECWWSYA